VCSMPMCRSNVFRCDAPSGRPALWELPAMP
jgi:hypothetical protein